MGFTQKFWKIVAGLLTATLLLAGIAVLAISKQGYVVYSVRSDSMEPVLTRGSSLVVNTNNTVVNPGDVVSYASPKDPRLVITHRVVEVYPQQGVFIAKGDNTLLPDDPVPIRNLKGTAVFKMPLLGYVLEAFRHPVGLAVMVYVPALGIVASEVARLKYYYAFGSRRHYTLHGY